MIRGVYVLTDPTLQAGRSAEQVAEQAFEGGASIVQLRAKGMPTPALVETARRLQAIATRHGRLFIVNDRVDVAAASGADGVHIGPDDMRPVDARRILGPEKLIGVSVSSVEEALKLAPYADYLAVGAIYGSSTKLDAGPAVGTQQIRDIRSAALRLPLVAIGGIGPKNIRDVVDAGADSAAVISAVLSQPDLRAATEDLVKRFATSR